MSKILIERVVFGTQQPCAAKLAIICVFSVVACGPGFEKCLRTQADEFILMEHDCQTKQLMRYVHSLVDNLEFYKQFYEMRNKRYVLHDMNLAI